MIINAATISQRAIIPVSPIVLVLVKIIGDSAANNPGSAPGALYIVFIFFIFFLYFCLLPLLFYLDVSPLLGTIFIAS